MTGTTTSPFRQPKATCFTLATPEGHSFVTVA